MRISRFPDLWRFLLISAVALICVAVTASLGFWQLGRAAQKQAVFDAITRQQALQPWHNAQLAAEVALAANSAGEAQKAHLLHRPVQLQGQWLAEQTLFLDNRQMQGRPGFWVLTPLRLPGEQGVVLVQRGWAPRDFQERTRLPDVVTPAGNVQIHGHVAAAVARLYEFAPAGEGEGASRIRQNLALAAYGAETGLPLLPLVVVQTGGAHQ